MMDRTVEIEAAEALLDVGVSLPLLSLDTCQDVEDIYRSWRDIR